MTSEFGNRASFAVSNTRALFIVGDPTVKCFAIPEYSIERERERLNTIFSFFFWRMHVFLYALLVDKREVEERFIK